MTLKVKLDSGAYLPTRAHKTDAGLDLYTPKAIYIESRSSVVIDTGVHIELPPNTVGEIKGKSGLNFKHSLVVPTGTVDVGYTGSIQVKMYNLNSQPYQFSAGDKVAQLVIVPILTPEPELVSELEDTERGNGGFGSTGK